MWKSTFPFLIGISSLTAYAQSSSTPLNVYDGFETEPLSDLWETCLSLLGLPQSNPPSSRWARWATHHYQTA
jgi:hypothetical protein